MKVAERCAGTSRFQEEFISLFLEMVVSENIYKYKEINIKK